MPSLLETIFFIKDKTREIATETNELYPSHVIRYQSAPLDKNFSNGAITKIMSMSFENRFMFNHYGSIFYKFR